MSDRGSGSVVALAMIAVVVLIIGWLGALAQAQAGRGRAQSAADLGALAGATVLRSGADPCHRAAEVVRRNDAEPAQCVVLDGGVVRVRATVGTLTGTASAWARAGPSVERG